MIDLEHFPPDQLSGFTLLNLCETHEQTELPLNLVSIRMPYSHFVLDEKMPELDRKEKYLMFCPHGGRSLYVARKLRKEGYSNVYSLAGGVPALEMFLKKQEVVC